RPADRPRPAAKPAAGPDRPGDPRRRVGSRTKLVSVHFFTRNWCQFIFPKTGPTPIIPLGRSPRWAEQRGLTPLSGLTLLSGQLEHGNVLQAREERSMFRFHSLGFPRTKRLRQYGSRPSRRMVPLLSEVLEDRQLMSTAFVDASVSHPHAAVAPMT